MARTTPHDIAQALLDDFNRALTDRDSGIGRSFHKRAVFRGSEPGEEAVGREAISTLLGGILASANSVRFDWRLVSAARADKTLWFLAVGDVVIAPPSGAPMRRAYALSGVAVKGRHGWRWRLFHGSEPWIAPADPARA